MDAYGVESPFAHRNGIDEMDNGFREMHLFYELGASTAMTEYELCPAQDDERSHSDNL